jgi:chromosome condensin MukBEF ATPase and DNA-binding subunit MukB
MARYVSFELAGLIRRRAYAGGALTKTEKRTKYLREQLEIVETERQAAVNNIAALDAQLSKYQSIDPAEIRPIISKPRRLDLHHGEFSAEMIWLLREMKGP